MHGMEIRDGALHLATLPVPQPAPNEVLIAVAYAGINRADMLQIAGDYAPPKDASPLPGLEVSGRIVALGAEVRGFSLGQAVCALLESGGYAQYAIAPAAQVLPLPSGIHLKEAASLPEAAATSVMALRDEGKLQAGERVLIHGATSGVGIIMSQIAKCWKAEVFGVVGGAEKAKLLKEDGITPIDHTRAPFAEQLRALTNNEGVDLIIDTLGGPMVETHLRCLRKGGRLVTLAMLEGSSLPPMKMTRLLMNHLTWSGTTLRSKTAAKKAAIMAQLRDHVWPHIASHAITPRIDSVFALQDAQKALDRMQERLHMGKILLEVQAE